MSVNMLGRKYALFHPLVERQQLTDEVAELDARLHDVKAQLLALDDIDRVFGWRRIRHYDRRHEKPITPAIAHQESARALALRDAYLPQWRRTTQDRRSPPRRHPRASRGGIPRLWGRQ